MTGEYDFAKAGSPVRGYTTETALGYQAIRPLALDGLAERLRPFSLAWVHRKFVQINRDLVPDRPGVYLFAVHPRAANIEFHSIILYFGRARNIRARFDDYLAERAGKEHDRKYVADMLTIYRNRIHFGYAEMDYYQTERIEDALIDAFRPCCNRQKTKPLAAF